MARSWKKLILQIVTNKVKAGKVAAYLEAAKLFIADQKQVPGCTAARIYGNGKQDEVVIVSSWESEAAMTSQYANEAFLKHKDFMKPYFIGNETLILREIN